MHMYLHWLIQRFTRGSSAERAAPPNDTAGGALVSGGGLAACELDSADLSPGSEGNLGVGGV